MHALMAHNSFGRWYP